MSRPAITAPSDASHWHLVFLLLSMERTQPFLSAMGLRLVDGAALYPVFRDAVRHFRAIENDDTLDTSLRLQRYNEVLADTLNRVDRKQGAAAAADLREWGTRTLRPDSESDASTFAWRHLLSRLAKTLDTTRGDQTAPPPDLPVAKLDSIYSILEDHRNAAIRDELAMARRRPHSSWETQVHKTYTPGGDPMDWVEDAVESAQTIRIWKRIIGSLSHKELDHLLAWAVQEADAIGVPSELVINPRFLLR